MVVGPDAHRKQLDNEADTAVENAEISDRNAEWYDEQAEQPGLDEERERARNMAEVVTDMGFSLRTGAGTRYDIDTKGWKLAYIDWQSGKVERQPISHYAGEKTSELQAQQDELISRLVAVGVEEWDFWKDEVPEQG